MLRNYTVCIEYTECMICFEQKNCDFVIHPCGHNGVCEDCLNKIKEDLQNKCPVC